MRGFSMFFAEVVTIFFLLEEDISTVTAKSCFKKGFLAAQDVQPLQNSSTPLSHVPAENLDGHVELSTLDLLPTSVPSHFSHPRKTFKHVMKRPIHQNSSSKINRNALTSPSSLVGGEEKSSIDGQVLTDTSKAHYVGDKHDNNHGEYDVEGGFSERKGSRATGNERGDKDFVKEKSHENLHLHKSQGIDHRRKVLKQINKRPFKHPTNSNSTSAESTTTKYLLEKNIDRKVHRKQFPEVKSPSENSKYESEETSSLPSLSLILKAANGSSANNRISKFIHEIVITTTENSEEIDIDMSTSVNPEQNDQEFSLFTQIGPENDESLFEFTGSTEQDLFEIDDGSKKENIENPSEKYTVFLPKSFSEEDANAGDDVENVDETTVTTRLPEDSTENDVFAVTQEVPNNMTSATERVENVTDIINKIPIQSNSEDTQFDSSTVSTQNIFNSDEFVSKTVKSEQIANEFPDDSTKELESSSAPYSTDESNSTETDHVSRDTTPFGDESETTTSFSSETSELRTTSNIDAEDFVTAFPNTSQENHVTSVTSVTSAITEKESTTNSVLEDNSVTKQTTTGEIVTIDPAHWYGINTGGDVIEVYPDTKSEKTTEVIEIASVNIEQQTSTFSGKDSESSTNSMLDISSTEKISVPLTTEEIVTVDPAHWYNINTGNGNIEVHPDTDKSENVTEVFEDKHISTEGDKTPVEAQAEEIVTEHPVHSYEITTEIVIDPATWSRSNTSEISNGNSQVRSNNRSDKALPLDETDFQYDITTNSRSDEKIETTTTSTTSASSGITADYTTEKRKEEIATQVTLTTNLLNQSSLELNGSTGQSVTDYIVINNSSNEILEDKRVVNSSNGYSDVVEVTTIGKIVESDTTNYSESTQSSATSGAYTSESNTEVPSTSRFTNMQSQYNPTINSDYIPAGEISLAESTTVKDNTSSTMSLNEEYSITRANVENTYVVLATATTDVANFETSSHSAEASITTETPGVQNKTTVISTFVKENLPSVLIQDGELSLTEHSTIATDKEVSIGGSPKESSIPSLMELSPISYKNILKIVESDETEDNDSIEDGAENIKFPFEFTTLPQKSEVMSEKNGYEETKSNNIEKGVLRTQFLSNQSKAVEHIEGQNNSSSSTNHYSCENIFGNDSVFIARNIIGESTNVSIHIKTEDALEYIPSDVYILEDLNHQLLNFTWKSSLERLNNSLALVLNSTNNSYGLSRIDLNIVKGGVMLHLKTDITNESQIYQKPEQCNFTICLNSKYTVTFSSLDFLKIQDADKIIRMGSKPTSEKRQKTIIHMEIVVGVIVIVVVVLLILYLLVEKRKRKTVSSDKSV